MSGVPASEERLRGVPWRALAGVAPGLDEPLARVLRGESAERVLDRTLRRHGGLAAHARTAVAEALFGVGLWRLRLAYQLGLETPDPGRARLLLAALVRDLGRVADAAPLLGLAPEALPPPRPPPDDWALRFSVPPWLAATLRQEAGGEAARLADALALPGPVCLRPNLVRATAAELAARLTVEGVETRPGALVPGSLLVTTPRPNLYGARAWRDGAFEVQDEASQLVGALVAAEPGEAVLDLCAGAGGKTLQLAAAVGATGTVHATDPDPERLGRLRQRAARAGVEPIVRVDGALPAPALQVDRALVDAPCSELGALRRGPDLRFRLAPARFDALPSLQRELLARAAGHVRRGGRLVYATCTFRRAEDEEVALAFEAEHGGFERRPLPTGHPAATAEGFARTWPHRDGCDGFFVAIWERVS